ncbi:MAG: C40 family peptidase [Candidatus Eremiobacteraeota bacterium]|nr:C40 family peptidase [Candidatus Eremiobacteraeota bacterium]
MRLSLGTAFTAVLVAAVFGTASAGSHATTHRVVAGETLATIAAREHVSVEELARVNQIEGDGSIAPGTVLALDSIVAAESDQAFAVSPEARQRLRALETISNMPSANADVKMWSADAASAKATPKQADAMHRFARGIISRTSSIAMSLTRNAMRFIGTPYAFGGTSASGFDCSGYVQHVFAMLGIALPRTADAQFYAGRRTRGGIVSGDLVFFQTYEPGPSHVGIYIGAGKFIHSSSHGVMISRLSDHYWANRYLGAKRVVASR